MSKLALFKDQKAVQAEFGDVFTNKSAFRWMA